MRLTILVAVLVVICSWFLSRASRLCDINRLESSLAKDIAEDFRKASSKYACQYDGVTCASSKDGSQKSYECILHSSKINAVHGSRCSEKMLQHSIEREVTSDVSKARAKYGCAIVTDLKCTTVSGRVACNLNVGEAHKPASPTSATTSSTAYSTTCDMSILEHELASELHSEAKKATRRFNCPSIASVECVSHEGWVDCTVVTEHDVIPSSCDINLLTSKIGSEFGEELLEAEMRFGCQSFSQHGWLKCKSKHDDSWPGYTCNIVQKFGTKNSEIDTSEAKSSTNRSHKYRYFRGGSSHAETL
jgi:hypothetical protein